MRASGLRAHCFHSPQRPELMIVSVLEWCNQSVRQRGHMCIECMKEGEVARKKKEFRLQTADQFSYLLPFRTWLRETTTLHP